MGMQATDCGDMVDMFAATITRSNTNVEMMGETMKYVAPVAGSLGVQFEDLALATGLLANVGIKASLGGTSLRTMLTNLSGPTTTVQKAMDKYNITLKESADGSVDLDATMQNLRSSLGGLPLKEQASAAKTLFGKTGMAGGLAIINASKKDYDNLKQSIQGSTESMTYWKKECEDMGLSSKQTEKRLEKLHSVFQESKDMADALGISSTDLTKSITLLGKDGKVTSNDIESLFTVFNKLNNASESQEKIMKKYGIQIEKNDDNSLNYSDSLKNVVEALRDKTKQERENILTQLGLADSIDQVNELCSLTPDEFDKTTKAIEETQSAAEKAQEIIDTSLKGAIMRLGSAASGLGLSIMSDCAPALSEFCDLLGDSLNLLVNGNVDGAVTKLTSGLKESFKSIPSLMTNAFNGIESAVTKQGPKFFSTGTSLISNICNGITKNQSTITTTLSSLFSQGAEFVSKNAGSIGDAGHAIIQALSDAFEQNQDEIGEALNKATEEAVRLYIEGKVLQAKIKLSSIPQIIEGTGAGLWKALGGTGQGLSSMGNWIKDKLFPESYAAEIGEKGTEAGKQYAKNLTDSAKENASTGAEEIGTGLSDSLTSKLASMDSNELQQLKDDLKMIESTIATVSNSAANSFQSLRNSLRESFVGSANIIRNQMVSMSNVIRNQSSNARNSFTTQMISISKVSRTQATNARNAVTTQMISMKNVITTQSTQARNNFTRQMISMKNVARTQATQIGQQMANGVTKGIQSGTSRAVSAARSLVNQVNAEMKKTAKINSPSKITTDYGENLDEGWIVGMKNKAQQVYAKAREISTEISNRMKIAVQGEMTSFAINASNNNSSNIINNTNISLKLNDEDIEKIGKATAKNPIYVETKVGGSTLAKTIAKPIDDYNNTELKRLNRLEGIENV